MKGSSPLRFLLLSLVLLTPAWAAKTPHQQVLLSQSQHVELAAALDETAERAAQAAQEEVEQQVKELDAESEVEKDLSKDANQEDTATSKQTAHSAQPAEEYNEVGIQRSLTPVAVPVVSAAAVEQERKSKAAKAAETMSEALKKKGKTEEAELAAVVGKSYDMTEAAKAMTEKLGGVKHVVSAAKTKTAKAATNDVKQPTKSISHAKVADKKNAKAADATKATAASVTKLAKQATDSRPGQAFASAYWDKHAKELGAKHYVRPVNKITKVAVHAQPKDAAKTQKQQKHGTWEQTDKNYASPKLPHVAVTKPDAAAEGESSESTLSSLTHSARKFFDHAIADISGFASEFSQGGSVSGKSVASVVGPADSDDAFAAADAAAATAAAAAAVAQQPVVEHLTPKIEDEKQSEHAAHAAKQSVPKTSSQQSVGQKLHANAVAMKRDRGAKVAVSSKRIAQAAAHIWDAAKKVKGIDVAKTADPQPATIERLAGEHLSAAEHEMDEIDAKAQANLTAIGGLDQVALQLSLSKHRLSQNAGQAVTGKDAKVGANAQKPVVNDLTNFAAKLSQARKKKHTTADAKATANTKAKGDEKHLGAPVTPKKAVADAGHKLSREADPVHPKKAVADANVKASAEHKKVAPTIEKGDKADARTKQVTWKRHHFARAPRYGKDEMIGDWGQEYESVQLSDKEMKQYYMRKMHRRKLEAEANDDDDDDDDSTHSGSRRNTFAGIFGLGLATVVACL